VSITCRFYDCSLPPKLTKSFAVSTVLMNQRPVSTPLMLKSCVKCYKRLPNNRGQPYC
jgi:hypothetical protein